MNEEEKAATLLSKSKVFKDIILAAKLLKFYQSERAAELAIDGFKRHLLHLRQEDVQHLWSNFPEIKVSEKKLNFLNHIEFLCNRQTCP